MNLGYQFLVGFPSPTSGKEWLGIYGTCLLRVRVQQITFPSPTIIIIIVWLVHSYKNAPDLSILHLMIDGCQTNVEWCEIRFHRPEPCMIRSVCLAVQVPWQMGTLAIRRILMYCYHYNVATLINRKNGQIHYKLMSQKVTLKGLLIDVTSIKKASSVVLQAEVSL